MDSVISIKIDVGALPGGTNVQVEGAGAAAPAPMALNQLRSVEAEADLAPSPTEPSHQEVAAADEGPGPAPMALDQLTRVASAEVAPGPVDFGALRDAGGAPGPSLDVAEVVAEANGPEPLEPAELEEDAKSAKGSSRKR